MAQKTTIEWTQTTWNPVRGCSRVSQGCRNCYAEGLAARFSGEGNWGEGLARFVTRPDEVKEARWTGRVQAAPDHVLTAPLRWRKPRTIFVNSTSDLFHEDLPDDVIDRVFAVMALCPQHTFQILTKRPERMRAYVQQLFGEWPDKDRHMRWLETRVAGDSMLSTLMPKSIYWPLPNVWLGTSVEDQASADARIPHLLATPAAVRFISAEPLLGPVDLLPYLFIYTKADDIALDVHPEGVLPTLPYHDPATTPAADISTPRLDWVICGGESGPGARPMDPDWARSLRDQCAAAGVPFFFKQWGEWFPGEEPFNESDGLGPRAALAYEHDPSTDDWEGFWTFKEAPGASGAGHYRVGKKRAGRLLDGVTHDAFPTPGGAP